MSAFDLEPLLNYLFKALLLPPGLNAVVVAAGLLALRRGWRGAAAIATFGTLLLWTVALPVTARALAAAVEGAPAAVAPGAAASAQAIVVLGGGRVRDAPEYGGDTVSSTTLQRLRYAALLYRRWPRPVLVSGGVIFGAAVAEATLMRGVLEREFATPVAWTETGSRNTAENARESAAILRAARIDRIVLVTHAAHMLRAQRAFAAQGLTVIPAATGYLSVDRPFHPLLDWLPDASALQASRDALHELLGLVWYALRYGRG
ncbi:MAG: YdcF family protein [Gammaproteobacteria bacterium]|nr:YdcF family protein [Gammaproteobacteria bacterium]